MSIHSAQKKITTSVLRKMKEQGEKIAMLTAYDYTTAKIIDAAEIDMILVGDSAANVMAGQETTLPITLDHIIYHTQCVCRGVSRAFVVADMPFGSYQISPEDALKNAIRIMKETPAQAIKLEGGSTMVDTIQKITNAGIPVMGHLGLTPQSIHQLGSYALIAKEQDEASILLEEAKMLEKAGCFSLIVEKIPSQLGQTISEQVSIPVVGIGAGNGCDGQVLVFHDMIGLNPEFKPKFVKRYADLYSQISSGVSQYIQEVKDASFPSDKESY